MIIFYNFLVSQREVTWNKYYHMLYVDNPVRTGFSFTRSDKGLVTIKYKWLNISTGTHSN